MKYKHAKQIIESHLIKLFDDGYLEMAAYVDCTGGVERVSVNSSTVLSIAMKSEDIDDFHHRLTTMIESRHNNELLYGKQVELI